MNLTEDKLIKLNFKKFEEKEENYHYFTLEIGDLCLISNASDEAKNGLYTVQLFDSEMGVCDTDSEVRELYYALSKQVLR